MTTDYEYKGYHIESDASGKLAAVRVYGRGDELVYETTSLDKAMRWVDAYRDGVHWAMSEAIKR